MMPVNSVRNLLRRTEILQVFQRVKLTLPASAQLSSSSSSLSSFPSSFLSTPPPCQPPSLSSLHLSYHLRHLNIEALLRIPTSSPLSRQGVSSPSPSGGLRDLHMNSSSSSSSSNSAGIFSGPNIGVFGRISANFINQHLAQHQQVRTVKVVSSLDFRCDGCRLRKRGRVLFIICDKEPRHKQRQGRRNASKKKPWTGLRRISRWRND